MPGPAGSRASLGARGGAALRCGQARRRDGAARLPPRARGLEGLAAAGAAAGLRRGAGLLGPGGAVAADFAVVAAGCGAVLPPGLLRGLPRSPLRACGGPGRCSHRGRGDRADRVARGVSVAGASCDEGDIVIW
ncbi:60S ribosomal protein L37 isoform X1 [Rissa tridactyla]|uniref:60S ribosomal protein L37 isoform X1 n=1 Tax=Rissa tridactyla TaxID=75485 RepID=UPI0023BA7B23|nr:60S ribosomal protein L37 isoform X1 [Rissa tridactyla]